jgi:ferritin-like metal-binding protein YciE
MKTRHSSTEAAIRPRVAPEGSNAHSEIIQWLRDAYAMERGMEQSLEKQSTNPDLSPRVRNRANSHLLETRRHAELVRTALVGLGEDVSTLKTTIGIVSEATKGIATAFATDERIKDLLNAYSMEHFEIACYLALIAAAENEGLVQIADVCRGILDDEERMAQSLRNFLPDEVLLYLTTART